MFLTLSMLFTMRGITSFAQTINEEEEIAASLKGAGVSDEEMKKVAY